MRKSYKTKTISLVISKMNKALNLGSKCKNIASKKTVLERTFDIGGILTF